MPYTVKDNIDLSLPGNASNVTKAINVLATQIKLLTGNTSWKQAPQASIAEVIAVAGTPGEKGDKGDPGDDGVNGLSAYQVWLLAGNSGTVDDFLASLKGLPGTNGLNGDNGNNGLSAYQIWLNLGNVGTETQFINSLKGTNGTNAAATSFIHIQDRKTDNTHGGSAVSGAWNTRALTTIVTDNTGVVSLSNNAFTLPAGTYTIQARIPFEYVARCRCRLRNVTDSTDILYSASAYFAGNSNAGDVELVGQFTLAASKALRIEYRCGTSVDTFGLGNATGFGSPYEIFTDVRLWKI